MAASPVRPFCGVPTTSTPTGAVDQNGAVMVHPHHKLTTAHHHNPAAIASNAHHHYDVYQPQHNIFVMDHMRAAAAVGMMPPQPGQPQQMHHEMQQIGHSPQTNLLVLSNGGSTTGNGTSGVTTASQLDISGSGTQQQPNAVLRVIIENMICAVTLDLLHSIFSRFGKVLRIITFNKNKRAREEREISRLIFYEKQSGPEAPATHYAIATNLLVLSNGGSTTGNGTSGVTTASQLDISGSGTQQQPNAVLRVIIENMICAVTLDLLHSIFSRFGKVLRIITFNKNNTFQALIQLSEANAAQHARDTLNGHQVYTGCCTLRIDYSKLATLNVKYNNDKSRDYTNPNLPSGELTLEQQLSLVTAAAAGQLPASLGSIVPSPFAFPFGAPPAAQYAVPQHAIQTNEALGGASLGPLLSQNAAAANAANQAALNNAVAAGLRFPQVSAILTISPVILVSNLDENKVTPDALFTLFGVYGDVQRVKILFNKKDNALIQFAEPQQAQLAIQHLDKLRWHEKTVRVAPSKHTNVQMPKEGQPDAGLTRDYSQSPLHRFKKPGSKNYMNIYPPSSTLHLSNIPPNITEEFLLQAFEERDFPVKGFKFFPKDHKMALVQLDDVESAINALIEMHNYKLAENAHLRVSFSKSGI
ncbi:hypothetical protein L596_000152 [Steinernema carpocapsae]|uniref:RRM domain-containing protein n=1 Tax=Steinernema carpocapsae TaxID=34508 RepID=A0A4U8UH09_STECR|nr:hypothetical protein L596_000152 [Steinernema carpocapsae]